MPVPVDLARADVRAHTMPGFTCWRCPPPESPRVCPILREAIRTLLNFADIAEHPTHGWIR